jgi:hypothetical protein
MVFTAFTLVFTCPVVFFFQGDPLPYIGRLYGWTCSMQLRLIAILSFSLCRIAGYRTSGLPRSKRRGCMRFAFTSCAASCVCVWGGGGGGGMPRLMSAALESNNFSFWLRSVLSLSSFCFWPTGHAFVEISPVF